MNHEFQRVPLGTVLHESVDEVSVDPSITYLVSGVYSFGRGLLTRPPLLGANTTYKVLYRLHKDQFVISQLKAWEGALGRITEAFDGWFLSPQFVTFEADPERLDIRYLEWYCKQARVWDELKGHARGMGARRDSVSPQRFLSLTIPLPAIDEQRRIVSRIEELADKINEARGLRQQTIEQAEALFIATRAGVFRDAAKKGTTRLEDAATLERGKFSHRPRNDSRFFGGDHPWIQIAEIESSNKYIRKWTETLNDAGLAISRKFPKGTLLVSIAATIGSVGILDFDCCVPDSIVAITPHGDTDSEYVYHFLGFLRSHLEGIAPQSAQKNINLQILSAVPIPLLEPDEQRHIAAYLDGLQEKVDSLSKTQEATAEELNALMPSILSRAFSGNL